MKLGFARRDITPDFSVPLAGYFRDRRSAGVHDRLQVRALVFGPSGKPDPRKTTVILQLDLLCADRLVIDKLRQGIEKLGLDGDRLLVFCIHTHSAFGGIFDMDQGINREMIPLVGENDSRLIDLAAGQSLDAVKEALENGEETTVRINRGVLDGLGTNRHAPDLPCDKTLFIVEFFRLDGKKVLLYNLCCHPTVMNGDNLMISADFAGAAAAKLESPLSPAAEETGEPYDIALFVNGSAGDMSTRFTRKESSFAECERYGGLIAAGINSLKSGVFLPLEKLELIRHTVTLKRAVVPDLKSAGVNLTAARDKVLELKRLDANPAEFRRAESFAEGAHINYLKAQYARSGMGEIPVTAGILRINNRTILCQPFELFSTLGLLLKKEKDVEIFGYAGEYRGYLADRQAYDNLDYEALFSDFARGQGERYIELVSPLL